MPRFTLSCVLALPIAGAILYACSPFNSADSGGTAAEAGTTTNDTSTSPRTDGEVAANDGGIADSGSNGEYDLTLADRGTLHCWDFQHGANDFIAGNNAQLVPDAGYVLTVQHNDNSDRIERQFDAGKEISVTSVRIDETLTVGGTFKAMRFATGFAQFYGLSDGDDVPRSSLAYAKDHVEVDIYQSGDTPNADVAMIMTKDNNLSDINGFVWVDTTWGMGPAGSIVVSSPTTSSPTITKPTLKASVTPQSGFTLYVGGNTNVPDDNPPLNITVRSICVGFH